MASSPLLALAAACPALLSYCGSGSPAAATADLQTESYLGGALDPNYLFLWTPRGPGGETEIYVEVQNAPHELPEQLQALDYGPATCAAAVRKGFESWTRHAGVPMRLGLAFHDRGETLDPELVRIEVSFRSSTEAGLVGYTRVYTVPFQPSLVQRVTVEIRVGPDTGALTGDMVYALLLHEFGHALGIVAPAPHTGHSRRAADVMFPRVRWSDLSKDDRLALRELYSMTPTMRRADSSTNGPDGSGSEGPDLGAWVRRLFIPGDPIRSDPARPAEDPHGPRCGSCASGR